MKRLIDIVAASLALVLLAPLFVVVGVAVRIAIGSPVFFRQRRPGLDGKPFEIIKFRTLFETRDADGNLHPDTLRLPPFGKWLRSTSLDELPEFWNVLRGDMSLVGPRPLLMEYLPRYTPEQARRHIVRPGMTGWAQVNGRNGLDWQERLALDVWYVENRSFLLDIKILIKTVFCVVSRAGISGQDSVTMTPFRGREDAKGAE